MPTTVRSAFLAVALLGCGAAPHRPAFDARQWTTFDVDVPDRDSRDLLVSFEASARAFGCQTEKIGERSVVFPGGARINIFAGVAAYCDEGGLALLSMGSSMEPGHVRVGCQRPTTREQCETLLDKVSAAR
jgi:hypothetical protein